MRKPNHIQHLNAIFEYLFVVMPNEKVSVYSGYSKAALLIKGQLPHAGIPRTDFDRLKPHLCGNMDGMLH